MTQLWRRRCGDAFYETSGVRFTPSMAREVDIRGDRALDFPHLQDPLTITHARVLACRYERWDAIGELINLVSLEVFDWLAPSLNPLASLGHLEQLHIQHMPNVSDVEALSEIKSLRRLILETRPGWDGSRVTQVDSLAPLRELPLEEVNLFGVRPASKTVDDLLAIPTLKKARLSKFTDSEIRRINALIPNEFVDWYEPSWGSAAELAATGEALPTGITFRKP